MSDDRESPMFSRNPDSAAAVRVTGDVYGYADLRKPLVLKPGVCLCGAAAGAHKLSKRPGRLGGCAASGCLEYFERGV